MPFSEPETETLCAEIEEIIWSIRRPPVHMRDRIREGQRIEGYTIELFLSRPVYNNPNEWLEESIAKIKYVNTTKDWRLYWKRADLKWHSYPHKPRTKTFKQALEAVQADPFCCFWG